MSDKQKRKQRMLISAVFLAGLLLMVSVQREVFLGSTVSMEVKSARNDTYQVFYDRGNGYNEADSVRTSVEGGDFAKVRFQLPRAKITKIRIDPGTRESVSLIKSICLESVLRKHCWSASDIHREFKPLHDIAAFSIEDNLLHVDSTGSDPYFEYDKSDFDTYLPRVRRTYLSISAVFLSLLLFLILRFEQAGAERLDTPLSALSKLRWCVDHRYVLALVVFAVLVIGKVHGSSLPLWDNVVKEKIDKSARTLLVGEARAIRSDEWVIQTPMYLAQTAAERFYPVVNPNIRSDGQNMLVSLYAPVFDITVIGKPFNWGFLLLGRERGLSWYWWSKSVLLFLLSFELALLLTNRDLSISLVGAFGITFAPFVQWWYSSWLVDLIIYSQAIIVAAWHYLNASGKGMKVALMTVLTISTVGFTLSLYPPLQVPLGYLIVGFLVFVAYDRRHTATVGIYDLSLAGAGCMVVGICLYSFVSQSADAIRIMMGTVFPGKRSSSGGNFDLSYLQLYLIDWLLPYEEVGFWNRCELSTFLNFLPAVAFVLFKMGRVEERIRYLGVLLFCYIVFQGSWLSIQYPEWFARYSLFAFVPEHRLHPILGLTALYLSLLVFSVLSRYRLLTLREASIVALVVVALYYWSLARTPMAGYLGPLTMMLTLLGFGAANLSFLLGKRRLLGAFLGVYIVIAGVTVNPLARGTGSIDNKVIARKILSVEGRAPGRTWAGVDGHLLGNFLVALGIRSLNSAHYYPDVAMWKRLDPEGKYMDVYNRYGVVEIQITENKTHFALGGALDLFTVFITMEDLKRAGVRYLLCHGKIVGHQGLVREVDKVEADNLYIYELIG
jgi:hypothetical protein